MLQSEYEEWAEYLATTPDVQEIQMAHLLYIQSAKAGVKHIGIEDFLITKPYDTNSVVGVDQMTEEEINKLAGVA